MDYFEGCYRKQNIIDYTSVRMATATEASITASTKLFGGNASQSLHRRTSETRVRLPLPVLR